MTPRKYSGNPQTQRPSHSLLCLSILPSTHLYGLCIPSSVHLTYPHLHLSIHQPLHASSHSSTPLLSHLSIYVLEPCTCPPTHLLTHPPNPSNLRLPSGVSSRSSAGGLLSPPQSHWVEVFFFLFISLTYKEYLFSAMIF